MPAPGTMGTAWIVKRTDEQGLQRLYLPAITSLGMDVYVSLSEIPTIVLGYENNFIIDLGNSLKISVTMKRDNPANYDDSQDSNPELWSNGKWYRHLESLLNFWQNRGLSEKVGSNGEYIKTGGFRFHFIPYDQTLYPEVDYNVFLSGALNLQYSTTYMVVQMNLQVANMQTGQEGGGSTYTITLHTQNPDDEWVTQNVSVPANFATSVPNCPSDWVTMWAQYGQTFMGWATTQGGSVTYRGGQEGVVFNSDEDLWAVWRGPISVEAFESSTTYTTPAETQYITIIAVGGGGGAGNSANVYPNSYPGAAGGGGAGGNVTVISRAYSGALNLNITVGSGGSRNNKGFFDSDGPAGSNGGDSYVEGGPFTRDLTLASGGKGGQGGEYHATPSASTARGGSSTQSSEGGDATIGQSGGDGGYGGSSRPNIESNRGRGAEIVDYDSRRDYAAGAGGGASGFRYQFRVNDEWKPGPTRNEWYESIGGNGGGFDSSGNSFDSTAGVMGGGGGSQPSRAGSSDNGSNGGNGIVIVICYDTV